MSECKRCQISVLDNAVMCPLCHGVLLDEKNENKNHNVENNADAELSGESLPGWQNNHASFSIMYPNIEPEMRKMQKIIRIVIFLAIVAESVCVLINYLTFQGVRWSLVTGVGLVYACFTLIYSVQKNKSHQRKMVGQLIIGVFMVIAIELSLGYTGWSFKFVIPCAIVSMDLVFGILMIVNKRNWQNYMMAQFWMIVFSGLILIPSVLLSSEFPIYAMIAFVVSVFSLASSYVFGDKKAENELRRRFHM